MKTPHISHNRRRGKTIAAWTLAVVMALSPVSAPAFTVTQTQTVTAIAIMGGMAPTNIKIRHTPLVKGSPVTKQILIMGEAGEDFMPTPPPYENFSKTDSDFGPIDTRTVRVRVFYRFVDSSDPNDNANVPVLETLPIEGSDPLAFAFEIDRGSVKSGILQYRILAERLHLVNGVLVSVGGITFPPTTPSEPQPFVSMGVQANASQVFNASGGRFPLPDGNPADGESALEIPAGVFAAPTSVTFDEIPAGSPLVPSGLADPVSVYHLESDAPINGLMKLSLLYPDFLYPSGQDGIVDGTTTPERNLSVGWWDGFAWRKIGGMVNPQSNTITIKTGKFGFFAIMAAPPLSPEDRRPLEKILTPNGDGINDSVFFALGDLADNVKIEIFDVTNHPVKTIYSTNSLQWDGRDDNGRILESGVYIYQYVVDGKRVSGIIGVAK